MPIFAATIPERRKRVLVRATNRSEAMGRFVSVDPLSAEQMQDALDDGESVWKEGTPFPADDPAVEPEAKPEAESEPQD